MRADRKWYDRHATVVAQELIGQRLVHVTPAGRVSGRIVETEAYLGLDDAASHASLYERGRLLLSRPPGIVYMYRAYGVHSMFNIVVDNEGVHSAVLIRALEPVEGVQVMRDRRGAVRDRDLTRGPGNVCKAMGFRLDDDGINLVEADQLFIELREERARVECSPRIGITKNAEPFLRYYDPESAFVSGPRHFRTGVAP